MSSTLYESIYKVVTDSVCVETGVDIWRKTIRGIWTPSWVLVRQELYRNVYISQKEGLV